MILCSKYYCKSIVGSIEILTTLFGRLVAVIGSVITWSRKSAESANHPVIGAAPSIPDAKPQGLPTLKMPTAQGWSAGHTPTAADGLKVNAYASDLKHPRWIYVLPNKDVLVAESCEEVG